MDNTFTKQSQNQLKNEFKTLKSGTSTSENKGKSKVSESPFHNEGILQMQGQQKKPIDYLASDGQIALKVNLENIKETSMTSSNREKTILSVFRKQKLDVVSSSMISNKNIANVGDNTQILSIQMLHSSPRIISPVSKYDQNRLTSNDLNYNDEYTFSLFPNMAKINDNSLSESNKQKDQDSNSDLKEFKKNKTIQKKCLSLVNESKGGGYRMMKLQKELQNIKVKPNKIRINGQSIKFSNQNKDDKESVKMQKQLKIKKKLNPRSTMNIFEENKIYKNQSDYINVNDQQNKEEIKTNQIAPQTGKTDFKQNKKYIEYNLLEHSSSRPLTIQATELASPNIIFSPFNNQIFNQQNDVYPIFIKQQNITIGFKKNAQNSQLNQQNKMNNNLQESINKNNAYQFQRREKKKLQSAVSRQISKQDQKKLKFLEIKQINPVKAQEQQVQLKQQKSNISQTDIIEIFSNQKSSFNNNYPFKQINFKESEVSNMYQHENSIESCKITFNELSQNFLQILSPKNELYGFKSKRSKFNNQDLNEEIMLQQKNGQQKFQKINLSSLQLQNDKLLLNQNSNLTGRRPSIIQGNLYKDKYDDFVNFQEPVRSRPIIKVPTIKSIYDNNDWQQNNVQRISIPNFQSVDIQQHNQQEQTDDNIKIKNCNVLVKNKQLENKKILKLDEDSEQSDKPETEHATISNFLFSQTNKQIPKEQLLSLRERSMQDIRKQIHRKKLINMNKDIYQHYTQQMRSQKPSRQKVKSLDFTKQPLAKIILNYYSNPNNFIENKQQNQIEKNEEIQKHEMCVQTNSNILDTENNSFDSMVKIKQSQNLEQLMQKKQTNPISEISNNEIFLGVEGQQIQKKYIPKKEDFRQIIIKKGKIKRRHNQSQDITTEMKIYEGQSQKTINYSSNKKKNVLNDQYSSLKKNRYEDEILMDEQNIESDDNYKSIKNIMEHEMKMKNQETEENGYQTFHELNTNKHNEECSQSCQNNLININSQEDMLDSIINNDNKKVTIKKIVSAKEIDNKHQIFVGQGFIQVNKKLSRSPVSEQNKQVLNYLPNIRFQQQNQKTKKIGQNTVIKGKSINFQVKQVIGEDKNKIRRLNNQKSDQNQGNIKQKNINLHLNLMKQFQSQNVSPKTSKYFYTEQDHNKNIDVKSDYKTQENNIQINQILDKQFDFIKQKDIIQSLQINSFDSKNQNEILKSPLIQKKSDNQFKVEITQNYKEFQQKLELQEKILNITEDLLQQLNKNIVKQDLKDETQKSQNFNIKTIFKVQTPKSDNRDLFIISNKLQMEEKKKIKVKQKLNIKNEDANEEQLVHSLIESRDSKKNINLESVEQLPFQPALNSQIQTEFFQTFQQSKEVSLKIFKQSNEISLINLNIQNEISIKNKKQSNENSMKNQYQSKQSLRLSRNNKNTLPSKSYSTQSRQYIHLNKDKIQIRNQPVFEKVLKSQLFNEQIGSQLLQNSPSNQSQNQRSQKFDSKLHQRQRFKRIRSINFISSSGNVISKGILPSFSILQSKNSKQFNNISIKKSVNKKKISQQKLMNINSQNSEISEDDCVNFENKDLQTGIQTNQLQSDNNIDIYPKNEMALNEKDVQQKNNYQYKSVGVISPSQKIKQFQNNKNRNSVQLQTLKNKKPINLLIQSQKLQDTLKDFDVTVESVIIKKINQISTKNDLYINNQKEFQRENTVSINTLASDNQRQVTQFQQIKKKTQTQNQKILNKTIQSQDMNYQTIQQPQRNKVSRLYNFENKERFNKNMGVRYQQNYLKELKCLKYKADHNLNMSYLQFQQQKIENQFKNVGLLGIKKDESILNMIKSIHDWPNPRKRPSSSSFCQTSFHFPKNIQ